MLKQYWILNKRSQFNTNHKTPLGLQVHDPSPILIQGQPGLKAFCKAHLVKYSGFADPKSVQLLRLL